MPEKKTIESFVWSCCRCGTVDEKPWGVPSRKPFRWESSVQLRAKGETFDGQRMDEPARGGDLCDECAQSFRDWLAGPPVAPAQPVSGVLIHPSEVVARGIEALRRQHHNRGYDGTAFCAGCPPHTAYPCSVIQALDNDGGSNHVRVTR